MELRQLPSGGVLRPHASGVTYENTQLGVLGELGLSAQGVTIFEWSSHAPGQGHTSAALSELATLGPLHASGIGAPGTASYRYWAHQLERGRISSATDDEGEPVTVKSRTNGRAAS